MKVQTLLKKSKVQLDSMAAAYEIDVKDLSKREIAERIVAASGGSVQETGEVAADVVKQIFNDGLLYKVDSHCWWGCSSQMREDELDVDPEVVKGTKVLVNPESLAELRSYRSYGERIVKRRAYSFLGLRGVYYVPKAFMAGVDKELKVAQTNFYNARKEFVKDFPALKVEWQKKMNELYDESLYPTDLEAKFRFEWTKFAIGLPDSGILSDTEYNAEIEKQAAQMKRFLDSALTEIASEFAKIINSLYERMSSDKPITRKQLDRVKDFADAFDAMNITRNAEMKALVDKCSKLLGDKTSEDFKEDDSRKAIMKEVGAVVSEFKKIKDERIKRAIDF